MANACTTEKPPLGVMPIHFWIEDRQRAVEQAYRLRKEWILAGDAEVKLDEVLLGYRLELKLLSSWHQEVIAPKEVSNEQTD